MQRMLFALAFMDQAGAVHKPTMLSGHPLISALIAERAATSQSGATKEMKKAPRVPISFIIMFECIVCDASAPTFIRMFTFYRLMRVWTSMR